ncbi:FAD-dependent monooxygenase [Kribbella sp. NPDC056951]|uniref:FAD-dependent monooxygenase n=1 Tax=Kribbella sp. NPDC056951 TaxID=3345978 RepID=UPI00362A06D6
MKALISGASIAGPALAYWLNRYGYTVTVVERAGAPRSGGYPIDIRGTALEVVRRMGILPQLQDTKIDLRRITFLNEDGSTIASANPHAVTGSDAGQDLEVRRGDLTKALYAVVRDDVEFVFDDSIESLDQSDRGVDVTFTSGGTGTFDLVFGADGLHSRTRELLFGPEEQFLHYLGYCFAGFSMPNTFGLSDEVVMWNTPGRAAAVYAVGDDEVHALLTVAEPQPEPSPDLIAETFSDAGWEVPRMLTALRDADDLFVDTVSQIRMPHWSRGNVALVGDAAYAPSFLTGQGTSLALVGAYRLAHSVANEGLAAYESSNRAFVTANQGKIGVGDAKLIPTTSQALEQRNAMLRNLNQ